MKVGYQKYKDQLSPTSGDIEGPFYKAGAPFRQKLVDAPSLVIAGSVMDTEGKPIIGAVLDFWQANEKGDYDLDGFDFRGKQKVTQEPTVVLPAGRYELLTVRPGDYQIGEHEFRCAHLHVKVTAPGFVPLTTQLYFPDDKYNFTDHWFNKDRVIDATNSFDFVLAREESDS